MLRKQKFQQSHQRGVGATHLLLSLGHRSQLLFDQNNAAKSHRKRENCVTEQQMANQYSK
jgi:hypothetical protein